MKMFQCLQNTTPQPFPTIQRGVHIHTNTISKLLIPSTVQLHVSPACGIRTTSHITQNSMQKKSFSIRVPSRKPRKSHTANMDNRVTDMLMSATDFLPRTPLFHCLMIVVWILLDFMLCNTTILMTFTTGEEFRMTCPLGTTLETTHTTLMKIFPTTTNMRIVQTTTNKWFVK